MALPYLCSEKKNLKRGTAWLEKIHIQVPEKV